jgi:hypothetical protein
MTRDAFRKFSPSSGAHRSAKSDRPRRLGQRQLFRELLVDARKRGASVEYKGTVSLIVTETMSAAPPAIGNPGVIDDVAGSFRGGRGVPLGDDAQPIVDSCDAFGRPRDAQRG